jgi:hypothetical protein
MAVSASFETPNPEPPPPDYPRLMPRDFASIPAPKYIAERLNNAIAWYDKSANKSKESYMRMRAAIVIGGALVPVLININLPYMSILTTILSLVVVMLVSLESVYHYREQWTNYRSTEQSLRNEYFLFITEGGIYATLGAKEAYKHFVDRVEEALMSENSSTLKVLTSVSETKTETKTVTKSSHG